MKEPPLRVPNPRRDGETGLRVFFAVLACLTLFLSAVLTIRNGETLVTPWLELPLPGLCMFRRVTGADCPGCGLTRSFVSMAHGQVLTALHYNLAGPFIFVWVAFAIPYQTFQVARIFLGYRPMRWSIISWAIWPLVATLIVQWIIRTVEV